MAPSTTTAAILTARTTPYADSQLARDVPSRAIAESPPLAASTPKQARATVLNLDVAATRTDRSPRRCSTRAARLPTQMLAATTCTTRLPVATWCSPACAA